MIRNGFKKKNIFSFHPFMTFFDITGNHIFYYKRWNTNGEIMREELTKILQYFIKYVRTNIN